MGKDLYISKKKILVFNLFFLLCILILLTKLPFQDQTTPVLNSSVNSTVSENYIDIYCKTYSSEIPALKLYIEPFRDVAVLKALKAPIYESRATNI